MSNDKGKFSNDRPPGLGTTGQGGLLRMPVNPSELAIFAVSALSITGCIFVLSRLWCYRLCPHAAAKAWEAAAEEDDNDDGRPQRSVRLQVSSAIGGDALDDGEYEDMIVDVARGVRTVGDILRALTASYAHPKPDHRELRARCLDEERDELVSLTSYTPLSALANVDELIVTLRHHASRPGARSSGAPRTGLLAERKAQLQHVANGRDGPRRPPPALGSAEGGASAGLPPLPSKPPSATTLGSLPRHLKSSIVGNRAHNAPHAASELDQKLERCRMAAEGSSTNAAHRQAPMLPPPLPAIAPLPPPLAPPPLAPPPLGGTAPHAALMSELASRASSGKLTGVACGRVPSHLPARKSSSGSFLESAEFSAQLERRKQLAEAQPSPKGAEGSAAGGADALSAAGGMSYLEMLAERIAARQGAKGGQQHL